MGNIHQSLTDQHYTPPVIIDFARSVMGGIDLDPCTSTAVNGWSVKANRFYTANGLAQLMELNGEPVKVWCNPPGGKTGNKSNLKLWLECLYLLWLKGKVEQFFFLFFNREMIGGSESVDLSCIPQLHFYDRIRYWSYDPVIEDFREGNYRQVGKGGFYVRRQGTSQYWIVLDADGIIQPGRYGSKKEAITATGGNYWIWTNSPTHPSSLLYFPPRNYAGWVNQVDKLRTETPAEFGRWIIPCFPPDLGAKTVKYEGKEYS